MSKTSPVVSVTTPNGPLVDVKTGLATFAFIKWLQNVGQLLNSVFDNQGVLSPNSVPYPSSTAIGGVLTAGPVASEWVSQIDSKGVAHLTQPAFSDLSGTATATQIPPLGNQIGSVTASQVPALSALNGSVMPSQVPPLSALSGQVTDAQLPVGYTGTITTAALTSTGAQGSMTFTNGRLTTQVQAT